MTNVIYLGIYDTRPASASRASPPGASTLPWSRVEGKYLAKCQGMLPNSGIILRGVHFWEVPFALMLSPGRVHCYMFFLVYVVYLGIYDSGKVASRHLLDSCHRLRHLPRVELVSHDLTFVRPKSFQTSRFNVNSCRKDLCLLHDPSVLKMSWYNSRLKEFRGLEVFLTKFVSSHRRPALLSLLNILVFLSIRRMLGDIRLWVGEFSTSA